MNRHAEEDNVVPKPFDLSGRRVFVAGHRGLVGSAIVRRLAQARGDVITVGRERLDLLQQADTEHFLLSTKPDVVIIAAGKVGGIHANSTFPAEFIYENLMIATNLIHGAFRAGVRKLLFLGSSCIYPKLAPQPMIEEELLTGPLEPTNEWYAVAKIAGVKRPTAASTAPITFLLCRPTCTAPETIIIRRTATSWRR
jgi:GDP-L-fucose synthase